jgi:hypothetical protein
LSRSSSRGAVGGIKSEREGVRLKKSNPIDVRRGDLGTLRLGESCCCRYPRRIVARSRSVKVASGTGLCFVVCGGLWSVAWGEVTRDGMEVSQIWRVSEPVLMGKVR